MKKSTKEERRRKKALAAKKAEKPARTLTAEQIKSKYLDILAEMSGPERAEMQRLFGDRVADMEEYIANSDPSQDSGEEARGYDLDLDRMRAEAVASARRQSDYRQYVSQKRATSEEQSVDSYLTFMSYALRYSRQATETDRRAEMLRLYVAFRDGRVFHVGEETYLAVHQEADRYTTTLSGLDYQPYPQRKKVSEEENDRYVRTFMHESKRQPYPDKLPFPVTFLGYGSGVRLPEHAIPSKTPKDIQDQIEQLHLLGHLLTLTGLVYACYRGTYRDEEDRLAYAFWCDVARTESSWPRGLDLEPWTIPHLVRIINDHRTFVIETELSGEVRRDIKRNKKELGIDDYKHMPKPFYAIRLQTQVIREKVQKLLGAASSKPKSYKTDVRGHERCRIRRGPLPIDPKLAEKLQRRGYKLFTTNTLDEETYRKLMERGLAYKRSDEWLAVKGSWVKDYLSPADPNLPYIPAVRKVGNVRVRPRKISAGFEDPAAR